MTEKKHYLDVIRNECECGEVLVTYLIMYDGDYLVGWAEKCPKCKRTTFTPIGMTASAHGRIGVKAEKSEYIRLEKEILLEIRDLLKEI